jgi:hypothetical protein
MEPSEFMSDVSLKIDTAKCLVVFIYECFAYDNIIDNCLFKFRRQFFHDYLK